MASSLTGAIRDFVNQNKPQTTTSQSIPSLTNEVRSFVNDPQGYTQSRKQQQFNPTDWDDRNVLGKIYDMMNYNPQKAQKLYSDYKYLQSDPTSRYYNPYSTATNRSVSNLQYYGIDTSNIDDNWFQQNDYLRQYLIYDGTTNTPSKPGKKASAAQKAAYEYYQIWKSEDATRKAENQWDQLQKELTYWAQRTDRNYSDEEVLAKIDWSKYGELTSMDANKAISPNEYNRAIGYSQAAMYGVLWNARNPGTNVDSDTALALSALGRGNTWKENKEVAAKLNAGNIETYSPYSVGSTMEKQGLYFGVDHFDRKWLEEHRAEILNGGDETAKKYYADIVEAVDYTEKLNDELTSMREQIDNLLKYYKDPEKVINLIKGNTTAYGDLFALDKTLETGELKNTTGAVDYRWRDIEQEIRDRCAKKQADAIDLVTGLVTSVSQAVSQVSLPSIFTKSSVNAEDGIGQYGKGNIDLYNRPKVVNPDGSTSTVRSMSFYDEDTGKEILVPTVIDGEVVSDEEAIDHYYTTGEYLGMFDTPEEATAYALDLHKQQAAYYGLKDEEEEAEQEQVTEAPKTAYDILDEARKLLQQSNIKPIPPATGRAEATPFPLAKPGETKLTDAVYRVDKDALRAAYDERYGDGAFDRDLEAAASTAVPVTTPGFARGPLPQSTATPVNTQAVTPAEMAGSTSVPVIDQEDLKELALQEPVTAPVFTETEIALEQAGQAARDEIGPTVMEEGTKAEKTALLTGNTSYYDACVQRLRDRVGDFGTQVKGKAKDDITLNYGSQYSVTKGYEDHEANLAEKQTKLEEITPELNDLERKLAVLADEDMTDEEYRNLKALSELTEDENWNYWRSLLTRYDGYGAEDFPDDYQRELYDQALGVIYGRVRNDYASDEEIIRRRGTQWWNLIKDGPLTDAPTAEDATRAEELSAWKTSLEDEIAAEQDYLKAHEGEYDDARKNRNFSRLMYEAACALPGNEDLDPRLFDKVESVYNIADTPAPSAYSPYNYYDLTVEYAGVDRAQATNNAKSDAGLLSTSADDLAEMTGYLEELGVTFTDDQQKNITANIAYMRNQSIDANYVAMDGNEDFETVAEENKSRIASSEVVDMINKARKVSPNLNVGVGGLSGLVGALSDINRLTGFAVNTGEMTPEEWNRFYYLFGADGSNKEAAQAYLNHILDPDKGAVTVRASIDKAQWFEEQGKMNPLTGFLAARGMKILAAPSALMYRVSQKIQGKEVSPYSKYYDPMKASMSADQGAKTALVDAVGGSDTTLGKLVGFGYDGGASVLDMIMARKISGFMVGEMANFVSTSSLGTKIVELAGRANRTGNEAFNKALQTGASLGMEGQELVDTAYAAAAAAAKASDAGKALSVINVAEKAAINASYALPMSFSAAEQEYWKVLMETGDEDKAGAMLATKFGTSMLTYMVIGKNFHKGYTANPDGFVDGVKTFFKQLGSTEATVGASSLVSNIIDENVEKVVLGADSRWGKNKAKYYDIYKSDAIAEKLADEDMKNDIIGGTLNSMIVAVFRQSASFAIGATRNASGRKASTTTEETGLSVRGITEESVNEPALTAPITEESVNAGPVLGLPSDTWGTPVADAKDTDTIMSVYGTTPTAGTTGLASVLDIGNPAAEKASAQIIVGDLCYGDTRVAAMTMQQLLDLGAEKDMIVKASLTDGAANAALRDCFDKTRSGLPLTQDDVNAIAPGLAADISTNPQGFDESLQATIKENRIANRTNNIAAANSKPVKTAEATVEQAKSTLATAQETLDAANDNFAVAQDNAQAALDNFKQDPQNKEALGPVEQTQNHLIGADTQVQEAQKAVEVQEQKVAVAEKDLQDVRRETMTQARTQAIAEVDQEMQAEADVAYNNGIATLQPLAPFGQSIRVVSSSGQPVMLTGMYDSIPRRVDVYTTEDGGLITTDAVNTEDIDEGNNNFWRTSHDFQLSGQHPANAPKVYFPASFEASVAGKPVRMIGIVGKEVVDGMVDPVIMDLGGNIYSINDGYVDIPNDYIDTVYDALEVDGADLPIITDIPAVTVEVNENDNTGSEQAGTELAPETGATLPGSAGTRDNPKQLPLASGRNDGSGDLSDAGSDGGQEGNGRAAEGAAESVGSPVRGDPERLLSKETRKILKEKGVTDLGLNLESDPQRFSSALDGAKETNKHGLFVDAQSPEALAEKGAIMILSKSGLAGAAVGTEGSEAGNIFGVFKNSRSRARKASASLIIQSVAQGGNKLDCYDGGLRGLYASVGMVPVAKVPFNREYAPDGWNYERDGEPDVVAWMLKPGETAESIAAKYGLSEEEGGFHRYSDDEIADLKTFDDYDEALAYRDACLKIGKTNPSKLELMREEPLSEEWGELRQRLDNDEDVPLEDFYKVPEIAYGKSRGKEGHSIDTKILKKYEGSKYSPTYITDVQSELSPEQVAEQTRIKNELDAEGSVIFDEKGKAQRGGEVVQGRRLDIVIGLAAAGKSSIADYLSNKYKSGFLDSDDVKKKIEGYDNGFGADYVHPESKFINEWREREAIERGDNVILPIVGDDYGKVVKRMASYLDNGYEVHVHMVDLPQNKAIGRALGRYDNTGRFIDPAILKDMDPEEIAKVFDQLKGDEDVSGYAKWNNDVKRGEHPTVIESSDADETNIFGELPEGLRTESGTDMAPGSQIDEYGSEDGGNNGGGRGGLTPPSGLTPTDVNAELSEPAEPSESTPPPVNRPPERVAPPPERDGVSDFEVGQRQWGREGAQQSDILHKQTKERLLNNNEYLKDHNADQIDRALTWIGDHSTQNDPSGLYGAIAEIESEGFNLWSTDGQVRMMAAINMAAEAGDLETEGRLSDVLFNRTGTDLGQAMQARKIWMTMTPTGRKHALQREARKIQDEYRVQGKKVDLKISDETLEAAANAKNSREFAAARRKMEKELSAQIPSDWKLKMRTIRMTSMLANPRTHIRNLEGNTAFIPMVEAKNAIATGLERINGLEKGERTKSIWRTKESKEFAKRDAEIMKPELQGTAKYYEMNAVERNRKAFGTKDGPISKTIGKAYQKFADFSSDMLEKEDWLFLNYHYQRALSGYMTANGYTEKDMKGETLEKARAYAILEAQKATYRDPNTLAKWLSDQKNKPESVQFVINAVQPFVKTPANIMRRGVEYNPVGLIASLITKKRQLEAYKEWEDSGFKGDKPKGAKSPSEVWDSVAAGMTGTMIAGLGAWLASLGILKVKASDTEKLHGSQDYSLEIDGKSYGIGNIIPMNIPLLLGASVFNEVEEGTGEIEGLKDVFARSLSAISDILEPVVDTTMMTSLNSLLDTSRYSGDGDLTLSILGQKILANYVSSYVPSIVGSAAKVIDTTRRKAYVETGDPLPIWSAMFEQMQNKIPYLSTQNVPYVDAWGNEEVTDRFNAFLQNFILPDKVQALTDSELDSKLEELYETTGEAVLPKTAEKKVTVNGESVRLNDQQWYEYGKVKGQSAREALQELIERPEFILLSDSPDVQAELVKKVYTYAKAKAAKAVFPEREVKDSWTNGALTADNVIDYIFQKEEEAAKKESITVHKKDLNTSLADFDLETAKTNVDYLRQAGVKDSSIKSSVSEYFKPLYKEAYERGDREEMLRIQAVLQGSGLGYENYKFDNWLK